MKKWLKRIFIFGVITSVLVFLLIIWSNNHVETKAKQSIYKQIDSIPTTNIGLVLGTSRYVRGGGENLYFKYRIDAAVELFKSGKVKHLLVSGDNHVKEYDEPQDMREALIERGVPDSCITLDYAGFRTLDSIIRCWKVFGQTKFLIISQPFHNERAVFIGRHYNLDVSAYNAQKVSASYGFKTQLREYLARVKAVLDVYILNKKPKFLGEPVEIKL
ncbi:MAG: SanA/YdcF family protein [bacterium]